MDRSASGRVALGLRRRQLDPRSDVLSTLYSLDCDSVGTLREWERATAHGQIAPGSPPIKFGPPTERANPLILMVSPVGIEPTTL